MMGLADEIEALIAQLPGLTESQLAKLHYGIDGYRQKVNAVCRRLAEAGRVQRRGKGDASEPFTYFPTAPE